MLDVMLSRVRPRAGSIEGLQWAGDQVAGRVSMSGWRPKYWVISSTEHKLGRHQELLLGSRNQELILIVTFQMGLDLATNAAKNNSYNDQVTHSTLPV